MNTSRIAVLSTLTCIGAWTAKAVAIGAAGGLGLSPVEGPLFMLGLLAYVVAVVSLGLALTAGRSKGGRALGVAAAVVVGIAASVATGALFELVRPADPGWAWSEVNLWVVAAVLLGVVLATRGRARSPHPA